MVMGKSLEDFQRQTDPRIHPSFLEMTPTNLMYCESHPPPPPHSPDCSRNYKNYQYSSYIKLYQSSVNLLSCVYEMGVHYLMAVGSILHQIHCT